MAGVLIVAHAPLASSLLACATHIFGAMPGVLAYDAGGDDDPEETRRGVRESITAVDHGEGVLVLTDVMGATPSNQADKAARAAASEGVPTIVLAGVNVPMLLRTLPYRQLSLDDLAQRALVGAEQGILRVDDNSEES